MLDLDESDKEVTLHVREPFLSPQIISDGVSTGLKDSGLTPWPKTNRMNSASHGGSVETGMELSNQVLGSDGETTQS